MFSLNAEVIANLGLYVFVASVILAICVKSKKYVIIFLIIMAIGGIMIEKGSSLFEREEMMSFLSREMRPAQVALPGTKTFRMEVKIIVGSDGEAQSLKLIPNTTLMVSRE